MSNILYDLYFFNRDTFNNEFQAVPNAIVSNEEAIYVGGAFTSYIKSSDLSARGAIINSSNASLIESLNFDGAVYCSVVYENSIYFGGSFTSCQGIACQNIIKINLETKTVDTTFDTTTGGFDSSIQTDTQINALAVDSSGNVYVGGGNFNRYKGIACPNNIAKLNGTTGALDASFNSNVTAATGFDGWVYALAVDSSGNVYVGGEFNNYTPAGGSATARKYIAKLNGTTAALDAAFNTSVGFNNTVRALALDSNENIYVGGLFTAYTPPSGAFTNRKCMAKLNKNTAALDTAFNTSSGFAGAGVYAFVLEPSTAQGVPDYIYAGGNFGSYNGTSRANIAKIRGDNAALDVTFSTSFGFNGEVNALVLDSSSGHLYVGGGFTTYKGPDSKYIIKISKSNAIADSTFNTTTGFNNTVNTLARDSAGNIYAGGAFVYYKKTEISAQRILKISKTTNLVDSTFNTTTGFDADVNVLALDSSGNVYVGGLFSNYQSTACKKIAKLNGTTAAVDVNFDTAIGFHTGAIVSSIVFKPSTAQGVPDYIYVGGSFSSYKTTPRANIAKIRGDNAALDTTFNTTTGFNQQVNTLALDSAGNIYAGGRFTSYTKDSTTTARNRIAKLHGVTAALDATFNTASGFNNTVNAIVLGPTGSIYVGGTFSSYTPAGGSLTTRQRIAKLNGTTAALDGTFDTTGFDGPVNALALDFNQNLYVAGNFTAYTKGTTTSLQRIAKLNGTTAALDTTFNTTVASPSIVRAIAWDSTGEVYVGGEFNFYKNTAYSQFISLNDSTAAIKYQPAPPSITNVVFVGSVVVGTVNTNPTTTTILVNDQPLPTGSIVRNSTTGQKFIKIDGGATAFASIPATPPAEWNWNQEGINAWTVLQNI